jgi:hypothetical protein
MTSTTSFQVTRPCAHGGGKYHFYNKWVLISNATNVQGFTLYGNVVPLANYHFLQLNPIQTRGAFVLLFLLEEDFVHANMCLSS